MKVEFENASQIVKPRLNVFAKKILMKALLTLSYCASKIE